MLERDELLRRIGEAERVVRNQTPMEGANAWARVYAEGMRQMLAALDERDALLLRWLGGGSNVPDCEACWGEGMKHSEGCLVPVTRTVLAHLLASKDNG